MDESDITTKTFVETTGEEHNYKFIVESTFKRTSVGEFWNDSEPRDLFEIRITNVENNKSFSFDLLGSIIDYQRGDHKLTESGLFMWLISTLESANDAFMWEYDEFCEVYDYHGYIPVYVKDADEPVIERYDINESVKTAYDICVARHAQWKSIGVDESHYEYMIDDLSEQYDEMGKNGKYIY